MRLRKPLRLADLDPQRAADEVTQIVYARARRDARRLGFVLALPAGVDPKTATSTSLAQSKVYAVARACAQWAISGKGKPEEVAAALRELRADLDGVEPGEASGRTPDLTTVAGVVVVAAEARLTLADGRPVEATEVATLASLDERSIRAAVKEGGLRPVGQGRPMRFAADVVNRYLYARSVPGFVADPWVSGGVVASRSPDRREP